MDPLEGVHGPAMSRNGKTKDREAGKNEGKDEVFLVVKEMDANGIRRM